MGGMPTLAATQLMAVVILTGCAAVGPTGGPRPWRADTPSLLVENRSGYQVGVYLRGVRIGTATPGRSCIRIPQTLGELELTFSAARGARYAVPIAFLEESRHWRIELEPGVTIKYDMLGLTPVRESCAGADRTPHS